MNSRIIRSNNSDREEPTSALNQHETKKDGYDNDQLDLLVLPERDLSTDSSSESEDGNSNY